MKDNSQSNLDTEKNDILNIHDYTEKEALIEDQTRTIISLQNKIMELESIIDEFNKVQPTNASEHKRVIERNQNSSTNNYEEEDNNPPLLIFDIDNRNIAKKGNVDLSDYEMSGNFGETEKFTHYYRKDILIVSINIARTVMHEAAQFKKYFDQIVNENQKIIIDLTRCFFFDSTFLGVLVNSLKKSVNFDGDIRLVMGEETKSIIFHVVNMDKVFMTFDNIEDAMKSYE